MHHRRVEGASRIILRAKPRQVGPRRRCARCSAWLAPDNRTQLCYCHPPLTGYMPRHDKHLDARLLAYMEHAFPDYIDLAKALGTNDRPAIWEAIARLRRSGVLVVGCSRGRQRGYRLLALPSPPPE